MFFSDGAIYPITCLGQPFTLEDYLHFSAVTDLEVISFKSKKIVEMMSEQTDMIPVLLRHHSKFVSEKDKVSYGTCLCISVSYDIFYYRVMSGMIHFG